jgi:hypothetical protein
MASLIVIGLVLIIASVLTGGFIAISIAINQGRQVRSVIWRLSDRRSRGSRR